MKKTKRILHLLPSNSFSGAENVVCTIIQNNSKYEMFYCSPKGPIEQVLKEKNIKYIPLDKFNNKNIKKIIKNYKIDIIHAHDFKASFQAAMTGFKGKIISHLHNNPPFIKTWNIYTIIYNIISKKFHKVAVVSQAVYEESIFKKSIKNKYVIINNVVNKKQIISLSKEQFNQKYDVAFIGRITDQKDPLLFIKIINILKKNNEKIKAVMIGAGDLESECIKLINEYNLSENIKMIGFISNPYKILKNCTVVLMPSKYEGFGLTAIESMCLKKPLLNSGKGGLKTIFKNNKEFICHTEKEYAELTNSLLSNRQKYDTYKKECEEIIKPYIQIDKWMDNIYSLYE